MASGSFSTELIQAGVIKSIRVDGRDETNLHHTTVLDIPWRELYASGDYFYFCSLTVAVFWK